MMNGAKRITARFLILLALLCAIASPYVSADTETADVFPVVDSLGQFEYTQQFDFSYYPADQLITTVNRDFMGRITEIRRTCPNDPGLGVLYCSFTYDEYGRFTEEFFTVEDSELELLYGYPKVEVSIHFIYERDGGKIYYFNRQTYTNSHHGFFQYNGDGEILSGQLIYETVNGDRHFAVIEYKYPETVPNDNRMLRESYGVPIIEADGGNEG